MNLDELAQLIHESEKALDSIKQIYSRNNFEDKITSIEKETLAPNFWNQKNSDKIMSSLSELNDIKNSVLSIDEKLSDISQLLTIIENNQIQIDELEDELNTVIKEIKALKTKLVLNGQFDHGNCFLSINQGAGGTESQDWAEMLLRMYLRFCEQKRMTVKIIDHQPGNEAGIKSATLYIEGKNAYGLLKGESGVHRLVRISPFDSNKRRHTSFAAVLTTPEVPESQVSIKSDDLRIDTFRSSGAGGQHVNTTDSAIRITHLPTGIVVQCQNERSQGQNKQQAMKMLMSKLIEMQEQERLKKQNTQEKKKIEWGSQIRSYILCPYQLVKDHRTGVENPQPEMVLNGNIDEFIDAYLQEFSQ